MNYRQDKPATAINPIHVYKMAKFGCTQSEIAGVLGCSETTIRYSFGGEWARGIENMKCRLRKAQYRLALKGNFTMMIWLGKQMLGQKEPAHEITGLDGRPLLDIGDLTDEQLLLIASGRRLPKGSRVGTTKAARRT